MTAEIIPFTRPKRNTPHLVKPPVDPLTYFFSGGDLFRRDHSGCVHHMTPREARRRQREHEQVAINAHIDMRREDEDAAMTLAEQIEAACLAQEAWPGTVVRQMLEASVKETSNASPKG